MGWSIALVDADGDAVQVPSHVAGSTIRVGGSACAELTVTYNYHPHFRFGDLKGRRAGDTIEELAAAVGRLGVEEDDDYWKATPGNAGAMCALLLSWAQRYPEAHWRVG